MLCDYESDLEKKVNSYLEEVDRTQETGER